MEYSILSAMFILLCAVCCFISFLSGFVLGKKNAKAEPRAQPELTEADKTKLSKQQREYENFMTYDGSEQK